MVITPHVTAYIGLVDIIFEILNYNFVFFPYFYTTKFENYGLKDKTSLLWYSYEIHRIFEHGA